MKTTIDKEFFEKWKGKDDVVKLLNEALCKAVEVGMEMFDRKERDLGARKIQPPKYIQRPKPARQSEMRPIKKPEYVQRPKPAKKPTNNLPPHYNIAGIDTMDLILKICEHNHTDIREGFYLANTLKYLIRYNNKNGVDDLNKAKDYLNRLIDQVIREENFYNVDGQGD